MTLKPALLPLLALCAMFGSLLAGGTWIAPADVAGALFHRNNGDIATIIWQLRLPRVVAGAVVGASLAVAGALLQGLLRNPLVDPFLTGVSAGAAVAIVASIAAGVSAAFAPAIGFVAGLLTAMLVAALARRGTGLDTTRLILAGVSLSSLFSAVIALVLTRLQTTDAAPAIIGWLAGSLAGRGWNDLWFAAPYVAAGMVLALLSVPALNVFRLGEVRAASAGVDVARAQWMILCAASLLTACAVSLSGTIGFVGLLTPHIARRIVGSDARLVVPSSAMIGAALTVLADDAARTLLAPTEIPIGVLLAFIGVPAFLYLYLRDEPVRAA
ncbi:MAG TPA: iron ABC transporter permease [Candidatus Baltobacteraceae bacterium]|jgi:iron complex transport system permease protein|nr:iron ABC transporter permease [Candidatus Baltobacteraceae bacterium]